MAMFSLSHPTKTEGHVLSHATPTVPFRTYRSAAHDSDPVQILKRQQLCTPQIERNQGKKERRERERERSKCPVVTI